MERTTDATPRISKSDAEWREQLGSEEYAVLREAATERPFTGQYANTKTPGVYRCRGCGTDLFRSETKFESNSGWPSFYTPHGDGAVLERADRSLGMRRVEVLCAACHGHLGHVFEGEGFATPTDQRYCINSASLSLAPDEE